MHEVHLDPFAEAALLTLTATMGTSTEDAFNAAVLGYATIMQGREGEACQIYEVKGNEHKVLKRILLIPELYESELVLRALRTLAACALTTIGLAAFFLLAFTQKDWGYVFLAAVSLAAVIYIACDTVISLPPMRRRRRH